MFFAWLIINIISIFICYAIAKHQKSAKYYWALVGALLGPFAIPFVLFSKKTNAIRLILSFHPFVRQ